MPKYKLKRLWIFLLIPFSLILILIARQNPETVENLYSRTIYPIISSAISVITGFFNFSIAELLIVFSIVFVIFYLILFFLRTSQLPKEKRKYRMYLLAVDTGIIITILYFLFTILCGLNYYRVSLADSLDLDINSVNSDDIYQLGEKLIQDANDLREQVEVDENGIMKLSGSIEETALQSQRIMNTLSLTSDVYFLSGLYSQPKEVRFSGVLSSFGVNGLFFPYTYEANINTELPDIMLPITMLHEQIHVRGYMKEDETNFLAYICGMNSGNAEFQYSATMMLLRYLLTSMEQNRDDRYESLYSQMNEGVLADYENGSVYIQKHQGILSWIGHGISDLFFKFNFQTSGVNSYQEVVQLLAAYEKQQTK